MPERPPQVLVATGGPVTARRAGRSADGLLAVGVPHDQAALVIDRFRAGAREAGKDPEAMPKWLHLNVSWAPTDEEALAQAAAYYPIGAMRFARGDLRSPQLIEQIARLVRPEDLLGRLPISADPATHLGRCAVSSTSATTGSSCTTWDATRRLSCRRTASTCFLRSADDLLGSFRRPGET